MGRTAPKEGIWAEPGSIHSHHDLHQLPSCSATECVHSLFLRWKEDTQTRGSLSTRVHADTLLSDSTVEQGPALCCGFLWAQISLLFGLWAKLRILIIMAQGHGDLSVCVPWGTVLRIRIMPSVASLLSKTYSVPGPAQTLGRQ